MITIKDIARTLVAKHKISTAEADVFVQQMVEVINEGLLRDRIVKIKGFGTFKLQAVKERASVNVNTGERVLINGHDKITFTPDNVMRDIVNKPFAQFETVVVADDSPLLNGSFEFSDDDDDDDDGMRPVAITNVPQTTVPETIEAPTEEFVSEPEEAPVVEEPIAAPVVEEPIAEPVVEEPIAAPVVEEPIAAPVVEETVAAPVVEETVAAPVVEAPVVEPSVAPKEVKETTSEHIVVKAETVVVKAESVVVKSDKDTTATQAATIIPVAPATPEIPANPVSPDTPDTSDTLDTPASPQPLTQQDTSSEADDVLKEFEEELEGKNSRSYIYYGILINIIIALLFFFVGYYIAKNYSFDDEEAPTTVDTKAKVAENPATDNTALPADTIAAEKTDFIEEPIPEEEASPIQQTPEVEKPQVPEAKPTAAPAAKTPTAKPAAKEPTEAELQQKYYEDVRVRTGGYYILGTQSVVTVKEGQTLQSITRSTLGEGMECYIEVYNGVKSVKPGDVIKIPKLKWKKSKK